MSQRLSTALPTRNSYIGRICNSSFLLCANRQLLADFSITFDLSLWPGLLIVFAVTTLISAAYYFTLRPGKPKLRALLVLLRAAYTMGLLLIILDAAIVHTREQRSRLLIIKSDLPLMKLSDAIEARSRDDVAGDLANSLVADRHLADRFSIEFEDDSDSVTAAVVNLTDTSNAAAGEAERLAGVFSAPLFVVPVSADNRVPDVSLNAVDSVGIAPAGLPLSVQAMLYGRGLKGRTTLVKLSDEALVVASAEVRWKEDSETRTIPLLFYPKIEGLHRYTIRADPIEGELNTENNGISFSIEVRRAERKVLFIEDQPTWEGKFIRRALEENSSMAVDYFAQVSRSAIVGQQQTEGVASAQPIISDFKQLAAYDALILGPVNSSSISERAAKNLTAFVEQRGGGLVILGSNDFNGSIISRSSPLSHLTPAQTTVNVENPVSGSQSQLQGTSVSNKSFLVPTVEGREVFRMAGGAESVEEFGPLADSYLRVKSLKSGAVALAIDGSRNHSEAPVLVAAQAYGHGRALLFAPSDSWKIALAETEKNKGSFALLWQNLILWVAQAAEPASSLRLRTSAVESGDTVRAYLTARDDSFNPIRQLSIRGVLEFDEPGTEGGTVKLPLTVEHDPSVPSVYELSGPALDEGDARLSVSFQPGGGEQVLSLPFAVQRNRAAWRESPETIERLRSIARANSGELYQPYELELLKSRLAEIPSVNRTVAETHRLRRSIALAFLLPLLMSLEYFIRKRYASFV